MSLLKNEKVNLRTVAERVGLAPCSVSAVLNATPASRSIPQTTKDKIFRAAAELNYRPNIWARSLRTKRTRMVAVVTNNLGNSLVAKVVAAAQEKLCRKGYLLVLSSPTETGIELHTSLLQPGIEGLIVIGAAVPYDLDVPVAAVDFSYLNSTESVGNGLDLWLENLGASAAETIVDEIEGAKPARHVAVTPRFASACTEFANGARAADWKTA